MNKSLKLNCKIGDLFKAATGIAAIDGGFIIGLHIITFLTSYLIFKLQLNVSANIPFGFNKSAVLLFIISNLNLAVIIYRVVGLTRGVKYNPISCFKQAFLRLPSIIILFLLGVICFAAFANIITMLLGNNLISILQKYKYLLSFTAFAMIPYGIIACIFIVDQNKSPFAAIAATFNAIIKKISLSLLINISIFYTLPLSIGILLINTFLAQYSGLINAMWFLFCHIITIIVYSSVNILNNQQKSADKSAVKVIVI